MKKFHRFNQVVSQTLGRAEKSEALSDELINIDQRVASMVKALEHTKKKLIESLRSLKSASSKEDGNVEKKRKALEEYKLSQAVINDARTFEGGLLSDVMTLSGEALGEIVEEIVQHETQVEQHVLEKLTKFHEDLKNIANQKEKLKKLVLDMDSARTRFTAAQARGERTNEIQDEWDNAQLKVDSCKDTLACDLYTLASKEVDMAVIFKVLLQLQIDFHRTALKRLEAAEPLVVQKIDTYSRRPIYGCPLDDHLRYSGCEIALVLEVCCSALCELGLKDEGLFRISGNALKVRKLKAAFDAGEVDLSDFDRDPHSIAGALKSYLRELPDSLMTNNLYRDWMSAVSIQNSETRLAAIRDVIAKLPKSNFANLRYLVKFLSKLVENQQITKMSSQNLAIVMAPNMIWSTIEGEGFGVNNSHGTLVELLISNANFFFPGEVRFTSPLVATIVDKTGGFLENGPMAQAVALSVNVAKAYCDDLNGPGDGQISPAKGNSSRRPKQPAPPPPPSPLPNRPKAHQLTDQSKIARVPPLSISNNGDRGLPEEPLSSNDDDEDEFSFSPTDINSERIGRPLPPRPPEPVASARALVLPPVPSTNSTGSTGFVVGHKKTKSLDRPLRPPPRMGGNSTDPMNTSMERQKNGSAGVRPFPQDDELEEILLAGFGELGGGKHGKPSSKDPSPDPGPNKTNTLPRPQQPQRPPLPNKMVMSAVTTSGQQHRSGAQSKMNTSITVRVSQSDESEDDEPVVNSLENEHIYYDVPSGNKNKFSPSSIFGGNFQQDSPVSLISVSKKQDVSNPKRPEVAMRSTVNSSSSDGNKNSVAHRRESLMKAFANDQLAGQSPGAPPPPTGGVSLRPRPPVPTKPKSADYTEKDITRF